MELIFEFEISGKLESEYIIYKCDKYFRNIYHRLMNKLLKKTGLISI